jgi:LAO/AO transport system kinase
LDSHHKTYLSVNPGVVQPLSVNPPKAVGLRRRLSFDEYVHGIFCGDRVILAKAITLIESARPEDNELAQAIIQACVPKAGNSLRIGITGVPGAGKSTFLEALGTRLAGEGTKMAILAVDPSSGRSGGSILGDKTRMEKLSVSENAFIRPSPSCGSLGGVARRTRETMILCEAAGFRTIFVETVGVGQSETLVHGMVDFFLLLMIAGAGDELQGIKRGIIEMADMMAINKAEGDNLQRAQAARQEYASALHMFPPRHNGWIPPVQTCSSLTGAGIMDIWETIKSFEVQTKKNGSFDANRRSQRVQWLTQTIESDLLMEFWNDPRIKEQLDSVRSQVENGDLYSGRAAQNLVKIFRNTTTVAPPG